MSGHHRPSFNPATGLPMVGATDTMGNPYGAGPRPPRPPTGPISGPVSFILRLAIAIVFLIYFVPHFWRPTPQPLLDARQFLSIHIESAAAALLPPNAARTVDTIVELASR